MGTINSERSSEYDPFPIVMSVPSELTLFVTLARALAHSVRGDLSVITNDLTHLATLLPDGEVDRAKARCANIAQSVGRLSICNGGKPLFLPRSALEVSRGWGLALHPSSDPELRWLVDEQLLLRAFSIACNLCQSGLGAPDRRAGTFRCEVEPTTQTLIATGEFRFQGAVAGENLSEAGGGCRSLAEFALLARGEAHVVDAVLGDLIFRAHNAQIALICTEPTSETLADGACAVRLILSLPAVNHTC